MSRDSFHKKIARKATGSLEKLKLLNPLTIHQKGTHSKAIFALICVCFLWGTTWVASKFGVKYIPDALQLAGIRQLIAGVCFVGFFIYKKMPFPKGKEWKSILILSFLNFIMSNGLSTLALQFKISAGLGAIIGAIFPLWIVLIGLFSAKNKVSITAIIGFLLGFSGVCVVFGDHFKDFFDVNFRWGILLSITATWTWAFATIYTKSQALNFNPYFSLGLQMLISGTVLYGISATNGTAISPVSISWQSWVSIIYLAVFGSVIAFACYLYALRNLPTEQTSIYAYINPLVAVILGSFLFGEPLTIYIAIGGAITLFGVFLVNKAFKNPAAQNPTKADVV